MVSGRGGHHGSLAERNSLRMLLLGKGRGCGAPSLRLGVSQSNLTSSTVGINGQGTEFVELEETTHSD